MKREALDLNHVTPYKIKPHNSKTSKVTSSKTAVFIIAYYFSHIIRGLKQSDFLIVIGIFRPKLVREPLAIKMVQWAYFDADFNFQRVDECSRGIVLFDMAVE